MNKTLTALLLAAGLATLLGWTAHAQIPGYPNGCPACYALSAVDLPAAEATVSTSEGLLVAGWGFLCETGHAPTRVDVFYRGDDGWAHPVATVALYTGLARPDVSAAFSASCPAVAGASVGFHAYVTGAIPVGARDLWINIWVGPYLSQVTRHVIVTD